MPGIEALDAGLPRLDARDSYVRSRDGKLRCRVPQGSMSGDRVARGATWQAWVPVIEATMPGCESSVNDLRSLDAGHPRLAWSNYEVSMSALPSFDARRSKVRWLTSKTRCPVLRRSRPTCRGSMIGIGSLVVRASSLRFSTPDLEIRSDATRGFARTGLRSWQFSGQRRVRGVVGVDRGPVGGAHV